MRGLFALVLWCLLLCSLAAGARRAGALAAGLLVALPLRLIGIAFEALFAALRAVLFLPARLLRARR